MTGGGGGLAFAQQTQEPTTEELRRQIAALQGQIDRIDANAKLGALKAKTIDATTSFFNLHHIFARELGADMGFLAWKDDGVNPYGNSIIANGAWLKANQDTAAKFTKVTQKAFAECAKNPDPCVKRWSRRTAACCTTTN